MIPRALQQEFLAQLREYPVVTILGPRQSGKTTLVRMALPDYDYQTYGERDVRQLIRLKDASLFEKFIKRLAGRAEHEPSIPVVEAIC
jgi:ABC-type polar amino acid transport system ATPase subunit